MIAVDTNILIYAHREDSPFYAVAARRLAELSKQSSWAIPWPCVHEFFSIVTHPTIFKPPTPSAVAIDQIEAMLKNPSVRLLAETDQHWPLLRDIILANRLRGGIVHDAKIAAICLQHGVREFWSADRDFSRFAGLKRSTRCFDDLTLTQSSAADAAIGRFSRWCCFPVIYFVRHFFS